MQINFERPPLNEVVFGAVFLPRGDMLIPHYGRLHDLLKAEYPNVEHALPLVDPNQQPATDPTTGIPLPRVWFVSEGGESLVQIQQDRIYVNWRQNDSASNVYPRFGVIRDRFFHAEATLNSMLEESSGLGLIPLRYDLTYINAIECSDLSFEDVFTCLGVPAGTFRHLGAPLTRNIHMQFPCESIDGTVSLRIDTAMRTSDQAPLIRFEIQVSTKPGNQSVSARDRFFEAAHDVVLDTFKSATSARIRQTAWKELTE